MDKQERMKKKENNGTNRHSLFLSDAIQRPSTSSRAASPANLFPPQGKDEARRTTAISGRRCYESYESFIRAGSSVKMLAALLLGTEVWYSSRCTLTWKVKVTKSKRLLFQLYPSTRHTDETEYGLLLTPNVEDGKREGNAAAWNNYKNGGRTTQARLRNQLAAMLPTPQAIDGQGKGRALRLKKDSPRDPSKQGSWRGDLKDHIAMLPTPASRDWKDGMKPYDRKGNGEPTQDTAQRVLAGKKTGLKLQPAFALWMMGYDTTWLDLTEDEMPKSVRARKGGATRH